MCTLNPYCGKYTRPICIGTFIIGIILLTISCIFLYMDITRVNNLKETICFNKNFTLNPNKDHSWTSSKGLYFLPSFDVYFTTNVQINTKYELFKYIKFENKITISKFCKSETCAINFFKEHSTKTLYTCWYQSNYDVYFNDDIDLGLVLCVCFLSVIVIISLSVLFILKYCLRNQIYNEYYDRIT